VSHPWPRHLNSGGNLSDAGDAAFDQGLVSFAEDGAVLAGRQLSEAARKTWVSMQRCCFAASATRIEQISGCIARRRLGERATSMRLMGCCREDRLSAAIHGGPGPPPLRDSTSTR
jgi:hypothetical protein